MQQKNNKKKKSLLFKILKRVKIRHFIALGLILIANTFAWFIYVDTVRNSIDVRVKSWKIDFTDGDTPVSQLINITVTDVMPGMPDYEHTVSAYNYSEVNATVEYTILEARIMDEVILTDVGAVEYGANITGEELTNAELIDRLENYYPFSITFGISSDTIAAENGHSDFTVQIEWPYESGNDTWDTYWGNKAYDYKVSNPTSPSIFLNIKLTIKQASV